MAIPKPTLFGGELLRRDIGQQQVITIQRPESIDDGIGLDTIGGDFGDIISWICHRRWSWIERSVRRLCEKATFDSIKVLSKMKEISVVGDDWRRHSGIIRPNRLSARLMLLLHCRSVLWFYLQSRATLQVISFIPKRSSSDIYPIVLPSYHQKNKGRLSTELNATDHLLYAKHHKRTKTSDDIDTNLSSLHCQPHCSWPIPLFSCFSFVLDRWFVVVQNRRILPQNGNLLEELLSWIEESFFPCQMTWLSAKFASFAQTRGWFVCSSLPRLHSSTTPFDRPSASLDFLHSLTPPHDAYRVSLRSVQDKIEEGVLSQCWCSLTLTLTTSQGYMLECGCHAILTQRCITVPFLSDFSLHPIQLWFLWLSYSNHSFQLISIQ